MSQPLVSVFSLVYNTKSDYIIDFIKSLRNSTYTNYEYILIDDCSPDKENFNKIKKWIQENNFTCKIIEHDTNRGICASINHAIQVANGKYIFGCSDDLIEPDKISKQVEAFENLPKNFGVIFSDSYFIDADGSRLYGTILGKIPNLYKVPEGDVYERLLESNFIPAISVMVKKSVYEDLGGYDEALKFEDYDMWLRVAKKYKFYFLNAVTCSYRIHAESYSVTNTEWKDDIIKIYAKHIDHPIAQKKIKKIMLDSYYKGKKIPKHILDSYMEKVKDRDLSLYMMRYNVPPLISRLLLFIPRRLKMI